MANDGGGFGRAAADGFTDFLQRRGLDAALDLSERDLIIQLGALDGRCSVVLDRLGIAPFAIAMKPVPSFFRNL